MFFQWLIRASGTQACKKREREVPRSTSTRIAKSRSALSGSPFYPQGRSVPIGCAVVCSVFVLGMREFISIFSPVSLGLVFTFGPLLPCMMHFLCNFYRFSPKPSE